MAQLNAILILIVGSLSTLSCGYQLPSSKQFDSKKIDKTKSFVGNQNQNDLSLDIIPKNAYPVELSSGFNCPSRNGIFPYPNDCTLLMMCKFNMPMIFSCGDQLHFNNVTKSCDDICSAHCDQQLACICGWETCQTTPEISTTDIPDDDLKTSCLRDGLYQDPKDCTQFIQCSNGIAYVMPCPAGLHFSSKMQRCEGPCDAACDPTLNCKLKSSQTSFVGRQKQVDPPLDIFGNARQKQIDPPLDIFGNARKKQIDYPLDIPENARPVEMSSVPFTCHKDGLFDFPGDCTLGLRCKDGRITVFDCSDIWHFNNVTKKCDEFCSARCDQNLACDCGWDTCQSSDKMTSEKFKEAELKTSFVCRRNGLFADKEDCTRYIECSRGRSFLRRCPEGQHFSKKYKLCDTPCNAKCDPAVSCQWRSSQTEETPIPEDYETTDSTNESKKVFTIKVTFVCFDDGLLSNPKDCNKYVNCTNGIAYEQSCPLGQHFNVVTNRCESPCSAKCDPTLPCKWREFKKIIKESPEEVCSRDGVYFERNPLDCKSYFRCEDGDANLLHCSEGQHFNQHTLQCEEPCDARCNSTMAEKCGWEDTTESTDANSITEPTLDFTCEENGLYENPDACENFIQCAGGQAYLINCQYGLHFDTVTQRCTTPCEARCDSNYERFCEEEEKNHSRRPVLRDFSCETDGYHANPIDCSSFFQCFSGSAYVIYCPTGFHYSPTLGICVTPCQAKCAPNHEEYCRYDDLSKKRSSQIPSNSVKQSFPLVSEYCPEDGNYPNPEECSSYIQCLMGQSFVSLCPEGLHFSSKTKQCESPCDAHCDSSMGDICGWDKTWTSTEGPEYYDMFSSTNSPRLMYHFTCMKDGLYKNPENCSTFIQCSGGHSYLMACPEGQHFNEETLRCDYPCDARCNASLACSCGWETCSERRESPDYIDCEIKPEEGPCRARISRYYYDFESGRCRVFYYGGCEGNSNNFRTREECEEKCQKKILRRFRCPAQFGRFGRYPDCVSYYHCKRGNPVLKRCPKGTAFDHKKSKCVTEYEATCLYECSDKDAVYPYEEDCRKFIDCVNGIPKLEKCPLGKAFDADVKDCIDEKEVSTCLWSPDTEK